MSKTARLGARETVFRPRAAGSAGFKPSGVAFNNKSTGPRESRPCTFTRGCPLADFLRHGLGLGAHEFYQKQFGHVSCASLKAATCPCPPPVPTSNTFAPSSFRAKSSRNERAIPSESGVETDGADCRSEFRLQAVLAGCVWPPEGGTPNWMQRLPCTIARPSLKPHGVHRAPRFGRHGPVHPRFAIARQLVAER